MKRLRGIPVSNSRYNRIALGAPKTVVFSSLKRGKASLNARISLNKTLMSVVSEEGLMYSRRADEGEVPGGNKVGERNATKSVSYTYIG